jgi:hypothetical protein
MEIRMEAPQELKLELSYDPAIPLLGIHLEESKSAQLHTHVYFNTIPNNQVMESAYLPDNG